MRFFILHLESNAHILLGILLFLKTYSQHSVFFILSFVCLSSWSTYLSCSAEYLYWKQYWGKKWHAGIILMWSLLVLHGGRACMQFRLDECQRQCPPGVSISTANSQMPDLFQTLDVSMYFCLRRGFVLRNSWNYFQVLQNSSNLISYWLYGGFLLCVRKL